MLRTKFRRSRNEISVCNFVAAARNAKFRSATSVAGAARKSASLGRNRFQNKRFSNFCTCNNVAIPNLASRRSTTKLQSGILIYEHWNSVCNIVEKFWHLQLCCISVGSLKLICNLVSRNVWSIKQEVCCMNKLCSVMCGGVRSD